MSMFIGGDFVPTKENVSYFISGEVDGFIGNNLLKVLQNVDYRIFNLESPLTNIESPIKKCGPNLKSPEAAIKGYKAIKVDLFTLANNHIMDQGINGLNNTVSILQGNSIKYIGAGKTLEDASKPYIFDCKGKRIGIFACTENEFSSASTNTPGACPYDPLTCFDIIEQVKRECDYVIVLYHGGKEHYQYPSPENQRVFHKMVNSGANLIISQHTHCLGCMEQYKSGYIVYGQGNFLFGRNEIQTWNYSVGIVIDDDLSLHFYPLHITNKECKVEMADDKTGKIIMDAFYERSRKILMSGFIKAEYEEYAKKMLINYLRVFRGRESFIFKAANRIMNNRLRILKYRSIYDEKTALAIEDFVKCEAHRELLIKGLSMINQ